MNAWLGAAFVLLLALFPCAMVCFRGSTADRLAGLEMAGVLAVLELVVLAQAFQRPSFHDLALALALLSFGGGLVFARFLERWL